MSAGHIVLAAYRDTGAWEVTCLHCGANPGAPCTKAGGRVSLVPCVGRLATADLPPTPVDFSQPRHPKEAS